MAYFTEILAEGADGYRPLDLDMRDAATLDDLIDMMRSAGEDGEAIAVIEHEDEWFGLVRLLADDEVRVFISDIAAAEESPYADIFADYLDSGPSTLDDSEHFDAGPEHDGDDDDARTRPKSTCSNPKPTPSGAETQTSTQIAMSPPMS
ncbi:tRNA adenosine deaminase-associated protein [Brevibacterium luteolum]|uniref:tRNA adenosine deaminase-associated protein n=1 Tax=Brevibacterium luteolum TaxID=199591 RepID=UPI00223BE6F8|nr:tRNA adenosine deaminase-associated protein [Brevibacterium luteolum]MCT1872713.1 tRNA adenosine deaminase-associated protein [Brevibacterium luteolum]MCT1890080.1 tRNA adenosine deaminase-associated protein [Brevibacterium luteolum]MCT1892652.1 tRNA adenosine deaminase-associated protein [Brevibacterium luteolum]MCT1922963.1 tRNA adenosine deaminase-associated protein [Brevibacterium luteolum]